MAVKEGWYTKNGSKWQTMPEIMLRYRAASFFGKIYAPELLMGIQSVEENTDIIDLSDKYPDATVVEPKKYESVLTPPSTGSTTESDVTQPTTTTDHETGEITHVSDSSYEPLTPEEYEIRIKMDILEWKDKPMSEKNKNAIDKIVAANFKGVSLSTLETWHKMLKELHA